MRPVKTLTGMAVAAAVAAACLAPSVASAARPRSFELTDCSEHTAFFPIPRAQGEGYVPEGFETAPAPADNENLTNFYVTSWVCGDPDAPTLELALTHLVVHPPKDASTTNHYLLDVVAEGPAAPTLRKVTCVRVESAAIDVAGEAVVSPLGPQGSVTATSVTADSVSASFTVGAERTSGWGSEDVRWFFDDGKRFFDSSAALLFWGIGSSSVAFPKPYLDLPPAAAGASKHAVGDLTFSVPRACRTVR